MITSNQGGGEMRPGGRGGTRRGGGEQLSRNWADEKWGLEGSASLSSREIESFSKLRSSAPVVTSSWLQWWMLTQICFSFSFHGRHKQNRLVVSFPECLNCEFEAFVWGESARVFFWQTAGFHLAAFPQRASIQFLSACITWVCLRRLHSSYPNTGVNCLHLNWTHTKHTDQTQ